jgi:DNA-binding transcriptional ArsR family regulator
MARMHPLTDDLAELLAQRFRALAEPMRLRILDHLRGGDATVQELAALLASSPQNVSKHLGVLRGAGIVSRRKRGNYAYYSVADDGVYSLCEIVCGSIERAAEQVRAVAR